MQTFALMTAAVSLSLLIGMPLGVVAGTLRPLPARDHAGARRDADRARVRLPDADRDPVLGRAGRGRRDDDDLRDPAGDPDHGARDPRRADEHGRGGRGARLDQGPGAPEGAAPARAADAAPLRQPGDPVRALDGRDRRADRRPRPRRRRHERHLLESRSGDPRRRRDRDHGDRARPLDRVDGRAHRSGAPPCHRSGQEAAAPRDARRGGHRCARGRPRLRVRRRRDLLRADGPGVAARPDPVGARLHPEPGDRRVRDLVADRQRHGQVRSRADQPLLGRHAVVRDGARADGDRVRRQRPPPGYHNARCARLNRSDGSMGPGDGHCVAGARRDGPRRRARVPARRLGRREPDRGADPPPHQRRAADAAAARLHHPVHLPDAGLDRAGDHRGGAVRDSRS